MARYRVALLGCGDRGRTHLMGFAANSDRFEVVALCDINQQLLQQVAAKFGIGRTYTDADRMLSAEQPDVFCFCTQPNVRLEMVKLAVKHKVKGLAYEKPMATSLAECRQMVELTRKAGIKAVVSHQIKYGGHFQQVKGIIDSGQLGRIHTIHATSKGWQLYWASHLLDYMRFFNSNAEAEWVIGAIHGKGKLDDSHPSPDYVAGIIQFANGVRGIVESGPMAPGIPGETSFWLESRLAAYGDDGFAEVRVGQGWRAITSSVPGLQQGKDCWNADHDQPPYIRDFADWLDDDRKRHPCNDQSGYKGFELMMGCCISALQRRRLDIPIEPPATPEVEEMRRVLPA